MTFWGYHTLLAVKAYHTILAARAYRRLDGSVGIFIDLTSDDFSSRGLVDRMSQWVA